ncbi:peptidoglycan DD-metalloendopeptidase family protein [Streptomyces sp. NPDC001595]|uniref:peptidoglycan DD-metalloendopeptidase family protein n=1 Tax=Streptomyces sp. NPDC001532 TaxID=3154520 RepID=UPI00332392D1
MSAFTIDMSHPFDSGFTGGLGGPNGGTHGPPEWHSQFGMDLGAPGGTEVRAVFDGHVTRFNPHDPAHDSDKNYGAELFMRSHNDMMGAFYTHITKVPPHIGPGKSITRGEVLGAVQHHPPTASHLHLALVEIIGGAPHGRYLGVDLYGLFLSTANSSTVTHVKFHQDGNPPTL